MTLPPPLYVHLLYQSVKMITGSIKTTRSWWVQMNEMKWMKGLSIPCKNSLNQTRNFIFDKSHPRKKDVFINPICISCPVMYTFSSSYYDSIWWNWWVQMNEMQWMKGLGISCKNSLNQTRNFIFDNCHPRKKDVFINPFCKSCPVMYVFSSSYCDSICFSWL